MICDLETLLRVAGCCDAFVFTKNCVLPSLQLFFLFLVVVFMHTFENDCVQCRELEHTYYS